MQARQFEKAQRFKSLHEGDAGFVIPNPWDVGSARLLESLGFSALASTSAGLAFSKGLPDGAVSREVVMQNLFEMAGATSLPISADMGNGFGFEPKDVASCIVDAASTGVVGGSIEDSSGQRSAPILDLGLARERITAAVEAVRSLPFPFTLTARSENYFVGVPDLDDTIRRLQAFQDAGADVLFAPGLVRREDIADVLRSIDRPLNVLIGIPGMQLSASELIDMGVRRVSVGGSLARTALGALVRAATELNEYGSTTYARSAIRGAELNALFSAPFSSRPG